MVAGNTARLYALFEKRSVEFVTKKRKSPLVPSFMERVLYGTEDFEAATEKDLQNWRRIAQYMQAAKPTELRNTAVMSGPVNAAEFVKRIRKNQDQDVLLENLDGTRSVQALAMSTMPASFIEQFPSAYFPYADAVVVNNRSPGLLMHELGHAVDLTKRDNESNLRRYLRWQLKPLLWQELSAWRKARKAYQAGYAASPEIDDERSRKEYLDNMRSYNRRKYPAFGSYLGGIGGLGLGAVGGGIAAGILTDGALVPHGGLIGGLGGGAFGAIGGALAGKLWAKLRENANKRKAEKQLDAFRKHPQMSAIREHLLKLREEEQRNSEKQKSKKKG